MQGFLKHRLLIVVLAGLLVALMVACAGDQSPLAAGAGSSDASPSQSEVDAVLPVAQTSQDVEEGQDNPDPSDDVAAAPQQVEACLNCHSDKEQLIATAAPVVEVAEESEGEG